MPGITRVGLILCATLLALPAGAAAQGIATTLHELRLLVRPGETVTVTDSTGRETKGRIESLSAAQIVLRTPDGPRQWSDPDLRVIRQRRGDSLGNGALIGFGIGAGIGIAGGLALRESGETGAVVAAFGALYGGLGAGIGVGFDALITRTYVIYDPSGAPRPQVRVLPLVAPTRQGLVVSVSF